MGIKHLAEAELRAHRTALSQIEHANKINGLLWDGLCEWGISGKEGGGVSCCVCARRGTGVSGGQMDR